MLAAVILLLLLTVLVATDRASPPDESSPDEPFSPGAGLRLDPAPAATRVQRIWHTLGRLRFHSDRAKVVAPLTGFSSASAAKENSGSGPGGARRVRAARPGARGL